MSCISANDSTMVVWSCSDTSSQQLDVELFGRTLVDDDAFRLHRLMGDFGKDFGTVESLLAESWPSSTKVLNH